MFRQTSSALQTLASRVAPRVAVRVCASTPMSSISSRATLTRIVVSTSLFASPAAVRAWTIPALTPVAAFPAVPCAGFAKKVEKGKGGKKGSDDVAESGEEAAEGSYGVNAAEFQSKMDDTLAHFAADLSHVKVGRPSPEQIENVLVDVGAGKRSPLNGIAQIFAKPPQSLVVVLYEPSAALETATCQAIGACGLDLNPVAEVINGAPAIRVPFPKPTTELRETLVKAAKAKGEDCKGHVRQVRKLWMDKIKKQAPPKDDAKRMENEAQKSTDAANDSITKLVAAKEKEIMTA